MARLVSDRKSLGLAWTVFVQRPMLWSMIASEPLGGRAPAPGMSTAPAMLAPTAARFGSEAASPDVVEVLWLPSPVQPVTALVAATRIAAARIPTGRSRIGKRRG